MLIVHLNVFYDCCSCIFQADCLHEGCGYNIVVLYHCKHANGHYIFPYTTPGKAFEFLGDGSKEHPASQEGRLFLQMFSQFFLGEGLFSIRTCTNWTSIQN